MESNIPNQVIGKDLNVEEAVHTFNSTDANLIYLNLCKRLMDVNAWHKLTDGMLSRFRLTDSTGKELDHVAHEGYYIKIEIPGPGSIVGPGFDWVIIEKIENISGYDFSSLSMRVRPVPNPEHPHEGVAHFFKDAATSTFMISKTNLLVKAEVHGRNELPNVETSSPIDKVRNILVATGAVAGMAKVQWGELVKGLLFYPGIPSS